MLDAVIENVYLGPDGYWSQVFKVSICYAIRACGRVGFSLFFASLVMFRMKGGGGSLLGH